MILQTAHLHHWTQLCICIVSDIFIFDCPYKIGTDVMPMLHCTLSFYTIMPFFQYSKTPDLHCCKSRVSLFQRFTPLLYGSVQAENSLRNYSSSEAMCANFSYFSSAYFSAFSKSCSALCGNARVRLL